MRPPPCPPRKGEGDSPIECGAMFLWADLVDLVRRPVTSLRLIDDRRRLRDGLLALALSVTLPALVSEFAALGPFRPPANLGSPPSLTAQGADIYARWVYLHRFALPVYGVLISAALWVAAAGLIHVIARTLGGHGDFRGYLKLAGFAALVGLVSLPGLLLDALLKVAGNARVELSIGQLLGLLGIAIFLWQNALLVFAARAHYGISSERAVVAVIGPIGAVAVLAIALVILAVILTIIAQQAPTP